MGILKRSCTRGFADVKTGVYELVKHVTRQPCKVDEGEASSHENHISMNKIFHQYTYDNFKNTFITNNVPWTATCMVVPVVEETLKK